MVIKDEFEEQHDKKDWWSVHAQKSRMIVYTPEEDFHIYLVSFSLPLSKIWS
jgi:hypothetical protein